MNILRTATTAALCVVAATVAACTSSSSPAPTPTPTRTTAPVAAPAVSSSTASANPRPAPRTSTATSHHAATPRPKPTTAAAAPPPTQPSPSVPPGPAECADGTVDVSAQRGGALPGEELALLFFTNRSSSACTITGFPGVELFAHDNVIGKPATRSAKAVRTLTVAPGAHVTALLHDDTRCNADLSDKVGVYVPNQTTQERIALQLRACALTIDPVRR